MDVKTGIETLVRNYKVIIILVIAVIFIIAAYYVFVTYVKPKMDAGYVANKEFIEGDDNNKTGSKGGEIKVADVYMFKVDWCPHCKKAMPIWEDVSKEYQGNIINGYQLNFILIDGEENPDMADKYNIKGFPTIKLLKDSQIIEYDAKPDHSTIVEFLNTVL